MRPRDFAGLTLLGALWGGAFLFIRVAVPALGPFVLVELRVGLAAVVLVLYALAVGRVPKIRSRWRSFLVLGFFNVGRTLFAHLRRRDILDGLPRRHTELDHRDVHGDGCRSVDG